METNEREQTAKRRESILDATLDLIAAEGMTGATYRKVAKAAQVPLGSMTYYFASRDELLLASFERFAQTALSGLEDITDSNVDNLAEHLTSYVISEGAESQKRDRILLAELYVLSYRDERYASLTRNWMLQARQAIERAVPLGLPRAIDALQEGLTIQRYFLPSELSHEHIQLALQTLIDVRTPS